MNIKRDDVKTCHNRYE